MPNPIGDAAAPRATYVEILKSTGLIGLSTVISIGFSIIRMKVLAVLLGPAGVGLFGLYSLIGDFATSLAGLGAQSSGVRQVAEAVGSGDAERIARTVQVLKWVSWGLAVAGAVLLAVLAIPVSTLSFGTSLEAPGVALLGVAVFLRLVTGAPAALIQGTRRIGDLAKMTVAGAFLNTAVTIPLVYYLGQGGVVLSLVAMALTSWLAAIWYARRIVIPATRSTFREGRVEARALLTLGFAFMASSLLTVGAAYFIRILVLHDVGAEGAGLYQSAWSVGGIYAGFILQAMGTDFYPRLTGVASDHSQCNRLVNEQTQVSILLAGPGLLATMTLAPLVISLFYSAEFQSAVPLLRWICLGMLMRIIAWPMGFIILAKGVRRLFIWTEVAAAIVQVGLAYVLLQTVGLVGAGIAFFGLYVWHSALIYFFVNRLTGFRWSATNLKLGALFVTAAALVFASVTLLPFLPAALLGTGATAAAGIYSLLELIKLLPITWFPAALRPLLRLTMAAHPQPAGSHE